jgi:ABC-type thiamin/hydroxymethylpyrimidine transport system permease subunit
MKFSSFTTRDWVYVAVFGALWGALELTLGAYLHVLFPPLANTFFTGLIMAGIGAAIALVGYTFVPRPGAVLSIGIITALLKVVSLGGAKIGPVVAILAEVILMEVALLSKRSPTRGRYVLAGTVAVSWNFFHKFIMMRLLYGKGIGEVYVKMVKEGSQTLGLDAGYAVAIVGVLFLFRVVAGAVAGWLAWDLGRLVARRVARA